MLHEVGSTLVFSEDSDVRLQLLEGLVLAGVSQLVSANRPDEAVDLLIRSHASRVFVTEGPGGEERLEIFREMMTVDPRPRVVLVHTALNDAFARKALRDGVFAAIRLKPGWAEDILKRLDGEPRTL